MNEIMNHGYVAPPRARAATVADLPRESEERPYIVGELTGEFDPFNDFPLPRRRTDYANHPAKRSELDRGLAPPLEDVGGHEIVGHHIARLRDHEPAAAGVPNYPPPTGTAPAAWQPAPSQGPEHPPDHHHPGQWQTTAQAQMSGQAAAPRRRSGKRMVPPQGAPTGSLMARGAAGVLRRVGARLRPRGFRTETGAPRPSRGRAAQERGPAGGLRYRDASFRAGIRWSRPGDAGELRGGGEAGAGTESAEGPSRGELQPEDAGVHQGVGSAAVLSSEWREKREGKGWGKQGIVARVEGFHRVSSKRSCAKPAEVVVSEIRRVGCRSSTLKTNREMKRTNGSNPVPARTTAPRGVTSARGG